ncbi:hypothetical protein [Natronorarus salvus]|uniref:hypothetical protein n=1 Tax=Natronorarus salvus TaxID=3117733 RepID=UPI002F266B8F
MNRRNVLIALGGFGILSSAGCLDDLDEEVSDEEEQSEGSDNNDQESEGNGESSVQDETEETEEDEEDDEGREDDEQQENIVVEGLSHHISQYNSQDNIEIEFVLQNHTLENIYLDVTIGILFDDTDGFTESVGIFVPGDDDRTIEFVDELGFTFAKFTRAQQEALATEEYEVEIEVDELSETEDCGSYFILPREQPIESHSDPDRLTDIDVSFVNFGTASIEYEIVVAFYNAEEEVAEETATGELAPNESGMSFIGHSEGFTDSYEIMEINIECLE